MRQFRDAAGIEWRVFLTERSGNPSSRDHRLPEAFRGGWLVFESDVEKLTFRDIQARRDEVRAKLRARRRRGGPRSR